MKYVIDIAKKHVEVMLGCKEEDPTQFRIIKYSLTTLIRKGCDKMPIVFVSENAKKEADKIKVNLFQMQWKDQNKFDSGRKVFHLEHKYTVNDMINDMQKDPQSIGTIFKNYQIGWILKCEDSKLRKTNRINHDATYLEADINLIFRQ